MTPRLKAGIFVRALIRRAEVAGASALVVRKGSEEAGTVFLQISRGDGSCTILDHVQRGEDACAWIKPLGETVDEARAKAYFEKQVRLDPDLWIVEVEDREGRAFVDDPIL